MTFQTQIVRIIDCDSNLFVRIGNIESMGVMAGETGKHARQSLHMYRSEKVLLDGWKAVLFNRLPFLVTPHTVQILCANCVWMGESRQSVGVTVQTVHFGVVRVAKLQRINK
jgi:hypothetical protein